MDRIIPQKNSSGNAAMTSWPLDVGYLFKALYLCNLEAAPFNLGDIAFVEYEVNGTSHWKLTGQELDQINQQDGINAFDGETLRIFLGLKLMKDPRFQELTFVNTGEASKSTGKIISSHTLNIYWNTPHNVNLWALVAQSRPGGPGLIKRYQRASGNTAVGFTQVTTLTKGTPQYAWWRRIFTVASVGNVVDQSLMTPKQNYWGQQVPTSISNAARVDGGHVLGNYFSYVLDFTALSDGYTSLAKTTPANTVVAGRGDMPMYKTIGDKNNTVTLQTNNDTGGGNNSFLLEAVGEID